MTVDQAINILVTVTLIEMMAAIGLGITFAGLLEVAGNWRLVLRAALANYICVPAVTVGLLLLLGAQPMVAAGFLILAACPGAPYGPPFTAIAKGNVPIAVGLMVLLAGSSAIVAPVLLRCLLPLISADSSLHVDTMKIVTTLLVTQLLPLCAGVVLRQLRPVLAQRLQPPAILLSKILNVAAVSAIVVAQFHLLKQIQTQGIVGMLALLVASLFSGWLLGGRDAGIRKALTVTTSLRNIAVGLVVATGSFAGTPALTAVVSYGLVSLLGTLVLAIVMGLVTSHARPATGMG